MFLFWQKMSGNFHLLGSEDLKNSEPKDQKELRIGLLC